VVVVLVDKCNAEATIINNIAVPGDYRVKEKESEKIRKYQQKSSPL